MPHYALVIVDPQKHNDAEIARNIAANLARHTRPGMSEFERARVTRAIAAAVKKNVGGPRGVGDLHTTAEEECPDGMPNCRNCGDPSFAASCAAAGHCPLCGTAHGIAPQSYLASSGVELQEVQPPAAGEVWNASARRFQKGQ